MKKINSYNDLVFFAEMLINTIPEIPENLVFSFVIGLDLYQEIEKKFRNESAMAVANSYHRINPNQFTNTMTLSISGVKFILTTDIQGLLSNLIYNINDKKTWFDSLSRLVKIGESFGRKYEGYNLKDKSLIYIINENPESIQTGNFNGMLQRDRSMENFLNKKEADNFRKLRKEYPLTPEEATERIVTKDETIIVNISDAITYMKNNPGLIEQIQSVGSKDFSISGDPTYEDLEFMVEKIKPKKPIDLLKNMVKLVPHKNKKR